MGVLLQIRDVDETIRDQLKARAKAEGISLNTYLRRLLDRDVEVPSRAQIVARLQSRGDVTTQPALEIVRAARAERDPSSDDLEPGVARDRH